MLASLMMMMMMTTTNKLFLTTCVYPWGLLPKIMENIEGNAKTRDLDKGAVCNGLEMSR